MRKDGDLIIYQDNHQAIWSSGTAATDTVPVLRFEASGNLAIFKKDGSVAWQSETSCQDCYVHLRNNGNLEIYRSGIAWQSNSATTEEGT